MALTWNDVTAGDENAGQAYALQGSRLKTQAIDPLTAELAKYQATDDLNTKSKSEANTASIIDQIRSGKTPEMSGFYNGGAITDARYGYEKDQQALAFKQRAEQRAIAAAGRSAASHKMSMANSRRAAAAAKLSAAQSNMTVPNLFSGETTAPPVAEQARAEASSALLGPRVQENNTEADLSANTAQMLMAASAPVKEPYAVENMTQNTPPAIMNVEEPAIKEPVVNDMYNFYDGSNDIGKNADTSITEPALEQYMSSLAADSNQEPSVKTDKEIKDLFEGRIGSPEVDPNANLRDQIMGRSTPEPSPEIRKIENKATTSQAASMEAIMNAGSKTETSKAASKATSNLNKTVLEKRIENKKLKKEGTITSAQQTAYDAETKMVANSHKVEVKYNKDRQDAQNKYANYSSKIDGTNLKNSEKKWRKAQQKSYMDAYLKNLDKKYEQDTKLNIQEKLVIDRQKKTADDSANLARTIAAEDRALKTSRQKLVDRGEGKWVGKKFVATPKKKDGSSYGNVNTSLEKVIDDRDVGDDRDVIYKLEGKLKDKKIPVGLLTRWIKGSGTNTDWLGDNELNRKGPINNTIWNSASDYDGAEEEFADWLSQTDQAAFKKFNKR